MFLSINNLKLLKTLTIDYDYDYDYDLFDTLWIMTQLDYTTYNRVDSWPPPSSPVIIHLIILAAVWSCGCSVHTAAAARARPVTWSVQTRKTRNNGKCHNLAWLTLLAPIEPMAVLWTLPEAASGKVQ